MDWPKARGILLAALTLVNLILAYSIWGPSGVFPELSGPPHQQQVEQVRAILLERGFDLAAPVPRTPDPMPFLRVEYRPTPEFPQQQDEFSGRTISPGAESSPHVPKGAGEHTKPADTQVITYLPGATGRAAREIHLENSAQVRQEVQDYLRAEQLLPLGAEFSGMFPKADTGTVLVEYVQTFHDYLVFSGFVRVEVSSRGIERVTQFWVEPQGYKDAPPKAVRPASEALLRLVGHLERTGNRRRQITEIRLGYYAGRPLTTMQTGTINAWDTVPVWRIRLNSGEVYYINAFIGELES